MYEYEYMTTFFRVRYYRPRTLSRTWSSLVRSEMRPGDLPWRLSMCHVMCQAKKKKRLEEMLVGAEPPIIVHLSVKKGDIL